MICPTCNAPVTEDDNGKVHFEPGKQFTEEIMVLVLKRYPDLLVEAINWSKQRNSSLWNTVKDIVEKKK